MALPEHLVIGLTGGIGSGKSAASRCFADLGARIIDTDLISHALSEPPSPALPQIAAWFGQDFLTQSGALDRTRMRETIFADPQARLKLESIFHPLIQQECLRQIGKETKAPYTILVVPLLFETDSFAAQIDYSLVIDCPEELQITRTMNRSGLSRERALSIMASQLDRQSRLKNADYVIVNTGTIEQLGHDIAQLHQTFQKLAQCV